MPSYLGYRALGMGFDAHLTVLYLGDLDRDEEKQDLALLFCSIVSGREQVVIRGHFDMFGPNNDILVLRVKVNAFLENLRQVAERTLWNASEFKDWNPHITIPSFDKITSDLRIPRSIDLANFGLY